jgi:Ca2+-binding RTX toxin-like protein
MWSAALTVVPVVAALLLLPGVADAAESCAGRPVTVASDDATIVGTDHDDVIVSHGQAVRGRGGSDVICVLGRGVRVDAGPDNDYIDATRADGDVKARLGTGDDVFLGSPGADTVNEGLAPHDPRPTGDTGGRDIIRTAGGADTLDAGDGSTLGPDRIMAAPGDDTVRLHELVPGMLLNAGPGVNSLSLMAGGPGSDDWFVDTRARTMARDDSTWSWRGNFSQVSFQPATDAPPSSVRLRGSFRDEVLAVDACRSVVHGAAGDDVIRLADTDGSCTAPQHVAYGGPGDDRLSGTDRPDLLTGGAGRERADGRGGQDTCRAEVTRSCEQT